MAFMGDACQFTPIVTRTLPRAARVLSIQLGLAGCLEQHELGSKSDKQHIAPFFEDPQALVKTHAAHFSHYGTGAPIAAFN